MPHAATGSHGKESGSLNKHGCLLREPLRVLVQQIEVMPSSLSREISEMRAEKIDSKKGINPKRCSSEGGCCPVALWPTFEGFPLEAQDLQQKARNMCGARVFRSGTRSGSWR